MGVVFAGVPAGAALAVAPTPNPTPNERLASNPLTLDAPQLETVKDGRADFSGSKAAGIDVNLIVQNNPTPYCQTGPGQRESTRWTCTATNLPSGQELPVVARTAGSSAQSAPETVDVLNPPTLRGASSGVITGTSYPKATIVASTASGSRCTAIPSSDIAWSCVLDPIPQSGPETITATQETDWSDGPSRSAAITIVIDNTPPAAPIISTPRSGAVVPIAGTTYSGRGESGATVDVYQSVVPVCSALVRDGAWTCSGAGLDLGDNVITALQRDGAGNPGPRATVTVRAVAPAATQPPNASAPPKPETDVVPEPTKAPAPAPDPSEPADPPPAPTPDDSAAVPPPSAPSVPGGPSGPSPSTGWNTPSLYGSALAPLPSAFVDLRWLTSLGIAIGLILLVALPSILLRTALAGRVSAPRLRLTGRNRAAVDTADGPANRWLVAGVCLIGAAGLVAVSLRVEAQENFLRLLLATTLGLAVVNIVGIVVVARGFRRTRGTAVHVRIAPAMLLLSAAAALLTRLAGLVPPLIVGQMLGFKIADGTSESERTKLALVQSGALTALSVVSWGLYSAIRSTNGFWPSFASETFSTITLAGLASAVIALVPLGLPLGRSLVHHVSPVRLGAGVVVLTIASAALASTSGVWASEAILLLTVTAVAFAALSVAVWLWMRFVEPLR